MEKKALGKGLGAVLPERDRSSSATGQRVQYIAVQQILPNPLQPRHEFSNEDLAHLVDSIKRHGLLQPVLVRLKGDGMYELIAGERRIRAAKLAGLSVIPALVRTATDEQSMALALVENIQRSNLNPIEEAQAYSRLIQEFGLTQEDVATRVGKDRSSVANMVRLLTLPIEVQQLVATNQLSVGHAKVLLSVQGRATQIRLAEQIVSGRLSVRAAERLVARSRKTTSSAPEQSRLPGDLADLEAQLRRGLGTKVVIRPRNSGGEIAIQYFSQEDLTRLVEILLPEPQSRELT
ncbi:MAG: ParB/RepB/Spo0J family partition protein [Nitrospirae bacterium]|nr:MAG: ParB/RepB/Spo0J family partition protein [Nitrospirota bacterium]